ncbi:hypothetical protein HPB51_012366 [Rhipicephalus microplus]|uniref:Endonuclease/exonuclease/phosphatase domain-containing protein n=1 Tax=Rhipicephalus microplus TaxID=6941 RepID=A0A9J6DGI6_RHIMP|nr:hypothetical protein HPB51_012366 [Rhipicephalus microplus]
MQNPSEQEATRAVERAKPATAAVQAHTGAARQTTGTSVEEDAASSVSEATAVAIGPRGDSGARIQAHARELEDEISRFRTNSANWIAVSARNYIMPQVFEMVNLCSDMQADAATERGAALALRGQLIEARREIAGLKRQVMVAERPPVGDILENLAVATAGGPAAVPAGPGIHEVTGTATMGHPVSGVAGGVSYTAALGSGVTSGIRGPSRNGPLGPQRVATLGAALRQDHVAFLTQVGNTENPARDVARTLKSNIDPVAKGINDVTLRHTRVRVSFWERVGTIGYVVEVDPEAFRRIMASSRISIGCTVVRAWEDAHVPTCTYYASYGHGRSSCPLSNDAARASCTRCAIEGHTGSQCTVREGDAAVKCAACQRAGSSANGHPAGHPKCPLLKEKVSKSLIIVVAGDFNAKHLVWGPSAGDDSGARLLEFAPANELIVLNDPNWRPTYENSYAASWIDVTLATSTALQSEFRWEASSMHLDLGYVEQDAGSADGCSRLAEQLAQLRLTDVPAGELFGVVVEPRIGRTFQMKDKVCQHHGCVAPVIFTHDLVEPLIQVFAVSARKVARITGGVVTMTTGEVGAVDARGMAW